MACEIFARPPVGFIHLRARFKRVHSAGLEMILAASDKGEALFRKNTIVAVAVCIFGKGTVRFENSARGKMFSFLQIIIFN